MSRRSRPSASEQGAEVCAATAAYLDGTASKAEPAPADEGRMWSTQPRWKFQGDERRRHCLGLGYDLRNSYFPRYWSSSWQLHRVTCTEARILRTTRTRSHRQIRTFLMAFFTRAGKTRTTRRA